MKRITILLLFASLLATAKKKGHPFIAHSSYDLSHPTADDTTRNIYPNLLNNKIVVKSAHGKHKFPIDSIWGFTDKHNTQYRIYRGDVYKLCQQDTLCIYKREEGKFHRYYFSEGIDGNIYKLDTKPLKQVFAKSNPAFLAAVVNDIPWYRNYEKFDKKTNSYKIVTIYKHSIAQAH